MLATLMHPPSNLKEVKRKTLPKAAADHPRAKSLLTFLVGGIWVAQTDSPEGALITEERFEWGLDRHFAFCNVVARLDGVLQDEGRGCMGLSPDQKLLHHWSFSTSGMVNTGQQVLGAAEKGLVFDLETSGGAEPSRRRIAMIKTGTNRLEVCQELYVDGKLGQPRCLTYERQPDGPLGREV